jgi:ribosome-associated translation inhibitor RaiA
MKFKPGEPITSAPLQISYHGVDHSRALTQRVTEESAKLGRFFDRIIFCRVVIDRPHRHHHNGALFDIRIEIGVPHELLVIRHGPSERRILDEADTPLRKHLEVKPARNDPYVAVRDAFAAAHRRLEDYARRLREGPQVVEASDMER